MGNITKVPNGPLIKKKGPFKGSTLKNGGPVQKATKDSTAYFQKRMDEAYEAAARNMNSPKYSEQAFKRAKQAGKDIDRQKLKGKPGYDANGFPIKKNKAKAGAMIKRADGSMSRRGLWDNIRANKGSGKKPTAAMLKQEKKIKAKAKK